MRLQESQRFLPPRSVCRQQSLLEVTHSERPTISFPSKLLNNRRPICYKEKKLSPPMVLKPRKSTSLPKFIQPPKLSRGLSKRRTQLELIEVKKVDLDMPLKATAIQLKWSRAAQSIKHLKTLNLSHDDIWHLSRYIPNRPLGFPNSTEFLAACKDGDLEKVTYMTSKNKWIVHSYDRAGNTGLHWASIRNNIAILETLLKNGTFVDSRDLLGRTPLSQAIQCNNLEVAKLLLVYRANPFICSKAGTRPIKLAHSNVAVRLLQKASLLQLFLKYVPKKSREDVWEREGLKYFRSMDHEILTLF